MEGLEGVQASKRLQTHFEMVLSGFRGHLCSCVSLRFKKCQQDREGLMLVRFLAVPPCSSLNPSPGQEHWEDHWECLTEHHS